MTRWFVFIPAARLEVIEDQDWYEKERASGLGRGTPSGDQPPSTADRNERF
ncbi:hypothetical protein B398_04700 [Xylella fastidiosa 32]|nr:hypothetical protein B398_04700 [Xylella fastidiosa 32]